MIDVRTVAVVNPMAEDVVERSPLAPRLRTLAGARVGLIDNSKRNSGPFLRALDALLRERHGVAACEHYRKSNQSVPASPDVLQALAASCDAVVHAVAD
ncbi:MAG: hypothetical protein HY691_10555 [Chloroflexi bacterium]|nr:hypothetical protein [Chloroflexota bacterium]